MRETETETVWRPEDNVQESGLSCYVGLEVAKADDLSSISKTHITGETRTHKISKQAILSVLLLKKKYLFS